MPGPRDIAWLSLFIECLIKSTLLLSLALCLAHLLRKKSASLRHFVLTFFFISLISFPVLTVLPSGWGTPLLPSWARGPGLPAGSTSGRAFRLDRRDLPAKVPSLPADSGQSATSAEAGQSGSAADSDGVSAALSKFGEGSSFLANAGRFTAILWLAGILVLLARLAAGLIGASKLSCEAEPLLDSIWRTLLERLLALTRLKKNVELKSHSRLAVPVTWGLFKPVVIMPAESRGWPDDRKSSALVHELSHIRRADFLIMILARLSLALFWFNPLSWVVLRALKMEQEKACDEMVLKAGIKPSTYAANLLMLKRTVGAAHSVSPALLGLLGRSQFNDRLAAILRQKLTFKEIKMRNKIMVCVSILAVAAFIGMARPSAAGPAAEAVIAGAEPASPGSGISGGDEVKAGTQDKQVQEKPEKAEAEKKPVEEAKKVKTVTVKKIKSADGTVEITIREGADTKVLVMDDADLIELDELEKDSAADKGEKKIIIKRIREPHPGAEGGEWTVHKDGKGGEHVFIRKERGPRVAFLGERDVELRSKLKSVEAELQKIKTAKPEMRDSLKDLENSLRALGEELDAKHHELTRFDVMVDEEPGKTVIVKKRIRKEGEAASEFEWTTEAEEDIEKSGGLETPSAGKGGKMSAFAFVIVGDKVSKTDYARAIEKVKKDLPEGYELSSDFDEKTGKVKVKIAGPESKGEKKAFIDKVIQTLKQELKIKEPAK